MSAPPFLHTCWFHSLSTCRWSSFPYPLSIASLVLLSFPSSCSSPHSSYLAPSFFSRRCARRSGLGALAVVFADVLVTLYTVVLVAVLTVVLVAVLAVVVAGVFVGLGVRARARFGVCGRVSACAPGFVCA